MALHRSNPNASETTANLAEWLGGGDASVWVNLRPSEAFPSTATLPNRLPPAHLPVAIMPDIGKVAVETMNFGVLTLDEFMVHPDSRAQAFLVIHEGRIVYETYPAMHPTDHHIWMSVAKVLPSLILDMLNDEGSIDPEQGVGTYVASLQGSAWQDVSVLDVMDMTTGLNVEEMQDGIFYPPGSIAQRMLSAEFGLPHDGQVEDFIAVLKDAEQVRKPGSQYDYSSVATQVLVLITEAVTGERWAQTVDKRVWSKAGFEGPLLVHTTPEGIAMGHGMISSRLRDLGRFGMLYTPSWNKIAKEQVVTADILDRIQNGTRSLDFFMRGSGPLRISQLQDDTMIGASRQWDSVLGGWRLVQIRFSATGALCVANA